LRVNYTAKKKITRKVSSPSAISNTLSRLLA
jgi:hypothetical protein